MVSVIVPVYQVEQYLEACVRSVLAQTCPDWELILVDDGSPDKSGAICDAFAKEDPRIRVIHQENQGLAAARNRGIEAAGGEQLLFLDSDDTWDPDLLEALLKAQQAEEADLVMFPLSYEDEAGRKLESPPFPSALSLSGEEMLEKLCREGNPQFVTAVNRLYPRRLWEMLRFPEGRFHEDEFTAHRIYAACRKIVLIESPCYRYRQRGGSITRQEKPGRRLDAADAFCDRFRFLKDRGNEACARLSLRSALHYYLRLLEDVKSGTLKQEALFDPLRDRLRRAFEESGTALTKGEKLSLTHPMLWRTLHVLRHGRR